MNLPSQLLPLIGFASLNGALLIAILFLLRPRLRKFSGSQWVYNCWAIVLLRLYFLPIGLSWSIAELWPKVASVQEHGSAWKIQMHVEDTARKSDANLADPATVAGRPIADRTWLLLAVWGAGAICMGSYYAAGAWRMRLVCRRASTADSPQLLGILGRLPAELRNRVQVRLTDEIPVAALAGVWSPQILLPRDWVSQLSDEELRHVILHEVGHACRGDLIGQWLMAVALCLHWFNPLIWLAARHMRADAELACDAWVLARVTDPEREVYGETLLKASQLFRDPLRMLPAAIGMAASRGMLVARVRHVGRYHTRSRYREVLGISLAATVMAILGAAKIVAQVPDSAPVAPPPPSAAPLAAEAPVPTPSAPAPSTRGPAVEEPTPETKTSVSPAAADPQGKDKKRRIPMIEIESKFIEVSESAGRKLGLSEGSPGSPGWIMKTAAPLTPGSVLDGAAMSKLLKRLNETKGVDVLSAPRVTTKSGQRAVIEIIREFRYPTAFELEKEKGLFVPIDFETRNLGVTLAVEPVLTEEDSVIDLELTPEVVELEGYVRSKDSQPVALAGGRSVGANMTIKAFRGMAIPQDTTLQPVFSAKKITTKVSIYPGSTILLGGLKREDREEGKPPITRVLYILVTARIIDPSPGMPPAPADAARPGVRDAIDATSAPVDVQPAAEGSIPVATSVPGKPGYLISPFAPKSGYIDARGFPSGTEIKCPFSGRTFKTP